MTNVQMSDVVTQATLEQLISEIQQLIAQGALEQAEAVLRPLLASGSGPIPLWRLLVQAIRPQGKITETRNIQEMLVNHFPGDLSERFNLAETLLLSGEFKRGWREYRHRYSLQHTKIIERKVQMPRWAGQAIPGRTLLIHDEQGYGDTFQFLRLVKASQVSSGARIILEINQDSLSIVQRSLGHVVDQIISKGHLPGHFDVHCEMMSLPNALGLTQDDLPGEIPYLTPDPARLAHWQARLSKLPRPLVALCWAGRPTHMNDANRSTTLETFAPLALPGMSFIAIQKGPAAEQALQPPQGMSLIGLDAEIKDFEDTAAILSVVDLLISVDSSPVHLAGALGCPVWLMLPMVPDWRWLLERTDSPWYPGHTLYRQSQRSDWNSVMQRMRADLIAFQSNARR